MRNLFKKSLTLCLVAILAFSCFAGIVSAETAYTATIAVVDQTITQGTTSVDVTLNITSSQIGINEALIEVSSDIGTINSKATLDEPTAAIASIELPEGSTNYGSFYLSAENDISGETTVLGSVTAAKIKVTFTVAQDKAVGTYPINIKVDGVRAASSDEDVITFTYATANVTIAAPHVHEYTYTPNGDKTHNGVCACNEAPITNEACVDGDDEDTLCDKCKFDLAEEDVCVHKNKTLISATAAVDASTPGLLDYTCDDCGETEEVDEVVQYHMYYASSYQDFMLENQITERVFIPKRYFALGNRHSFDPTTDKMFLYVDKDFKDSSYSEEKVYEFADAYNGSYYNSSKGQNEDCYVWDLYIRSVDMSDAINCAIFVQYDGIWYSAKSYDYCARNYIMDTLETLESTTDAKQIQLRTLLVDLLNYGAAAQTKFAYNTENLANALLTSTQVAFGTSGDVDDLENQYSNNFNEFTSNYGRVIYLDKTSFDLQSRILANIQFFKGQYTAANTDDLVVKVSFTRASGELVEKTYVNEKFATEQQLEDGYYYTETADGKYGNFQFCELASPDLRQAFSITMFKGEEQVSCIAQDSAQSFAFDVLDIGTTVDKALANEMIQYSDSANVYFNNK